MRGRTAPVPLIQAVVEEGGGELGRGSPDRKTRGRRSAMAVRIRARDSTMDCGNSSGRAHVVIQYKAVSGTVILLMISIPNILVIMLILRDLYKSGKVNVPRILVLCLAFSDFSYGGMDILIYFIHLIKYVYSTPRDNSVMYIITFLFIFHCGV